MPRTWLLRPHRSTKTQQARPSRPRRPSLWLEMLEQRTVPSFLPPVSYGLGARPTEPVIADFNNDGIPDLAVAVSQGPGANGYAAIYLSDGQGGLTPAGTFALGTTPDGLRAADLNGDGTIDLVSANFNSANVSVLLGNGDGTFPGQMNFDVGIDPFQVAVGDFNAPSRTRWRCGQLCP
jgi:hypothetical protein